MTEGERERVKRGEGQIDREVKGGERERERKRESSAGRQAAGRALRWREHESASEKNDSFHGRDGAL